MFFAFLCIECSIWNTDRLFYCEENDTLNCTYLTTQELSERIKYDVRTIRDHLKDAVLLEGVHYIRPFGGRKVLYIWESIEKEMHKHSQREAIAIPMAGGRVCHG